MAINADIQKNGVIKITGTTGEREVVTDKAGVIRHVLWNGPSTDGSVAELQDKDGNIVWADEFQLVVSTNGGANSSRHDLNYNMNFNGLYVSNLDSGVLLLVVDVLQ